MEETPQPGKTRPILLIVVSCGALQRTNCTPAGTIPGDVKSGLARWCVLPTAPYLITITQTVPVS